TMTTTSTPVARTRSPARTPTISGLSPSARSGPPWSAQAVVARRTDLMGVLIIMSGGDAAPHEPSATRRAPPDAPGHVRCRQRPAGDDARGDRRAPPDAWPRGEHRGGGGGRAAGTRAARPPPDARRLHRGDRHPRALSALPARAPGHHRRRGDRGDRALAAPL